MAARRHIPISGVFSSRALPARRHIPIFRVLSSRGLSLTSISAPTSPIRRNLPALFPTTPRRACPRATGSQRVRARRAGALDRLSPGGGLHGDEHSRAPTAAVKRSDATAPAPVADGNASDTTASAFAADGNESDTAAPAPVADANESVTAAGVLAPRARRAVERPLAPLSVTTRWATVTVATRAPHDARRIHFPPTR